MILRRFLNPRGHSGVIKFSGRSVVVPGSFRDCWGFVLGFVLGSMGVVQGRSRVIRGSFGIRSEVGSRSGFVRKFFDSFFEKIFEKKFAII